VARTKEQNERMRIATRDKILNAAISLFAEKGLLATSVQDIASRAEVSVGLLYHYFKTKEEVFDELIRYAEIETKQVMDMPVDEMCNEIIKEFQSGYEFSQWVTVIPNQVLVKAFGQFFTAVLKGLCHLQLELKDLFCVPTVDMLIGCIVKEDESV